MSHAVQKMPQNLSLMPPAESLRLSRRFRKILKNLMEWYIKTYWALTQDEVAYLYQDLSDQDNSSSEASGNYKEETDEVPALNNHGCCPGLEGQPHINYSLALDNWQQ
ncbi:hypothetical protein DSO57_1032221 [Entomophthora muscae]|uniref:Uncharacterized protein n=1 Tax=Entomophthora muscae TaxID=34485 RepID=A0ACC2TYK1_9FUNG|nr:hypothetical protein DSO57_1032221 [Entomophthora muscae]